MMMTEELESSLYAQIAELNAQVAERDARIATLHAEIADRDATIAKLQSRVTRCKCTDDFGNVTE